MDEYVRNDAQRANLPTRKLLSTLLTILLFPLAPNSVVYDSVEISPHYENTGNDFYIDERELIQLPMPQQSESSTVNEPYQKKYYFNPNNLPYNLEQPPSYSARVISTGDKNSSKLSD